MEDNESMSEGEQEEEMERRNFIKFKNQYEMHKKEIEEQYGKTKRD